MSMQEVYEQVPLDSLFPIKVSDATILPPAEPGTEAPVFTAHVGHWHEHLEILYFETGGCYFRCGTETFLTKDGDVLVVNPSEIHHQWLGPHEARYRFLIINPRIYEGEGKDICRLKYWEPLAKQQCGFAHRVTADGEVRHLVRQIFLEFDAKDTAWEIATRGLVLTLLSALFRRHLRDKSTNRQHRRQMEQVSRLKKALEYVEENYAQPLRPCDLAEICGWDLSYFCRVFKKNTGTTTAGYIAGYRIAKAEALLRGSDLSITRIAFEVGFEDSSYFSRCFKAMRGISPAQVRRGLKENDVRSN